VVNNNHNNNNNNNTWRFLRACALNYSKYGCGCQWKEAFPWHTELHYKHNETVNLFKEYMWGEGHVARMGERKGVYRVLVGEHEGKRPLGRSRRKWKDNIKMDLQGVRCGDMGWIEQAQDKNRWWAFVNAVINFRADKTKGNFLTSWEPVSVSRRTLFHGVSKHVNRTCCK
jgi:hypothetical protein